MLMQYIDTIIGLSEADKYIRKPALFIAATHDYACPASLGKASIKQWAPHAEIVELDCGHWVQLEATDEVNRILERWIEGLLLGEKASL